jgi:hypothetical protein
MANAAMPHSRPNGRFKPPPDLAFGLLAANRLCFLLLARGWLSLIGATRAPFRHFKFNLARRFKSG